VPKAGLNWHDLAIDGYDEDSELSTGVSFGKQELRSLTTVLGVSLRNAVASRVHFYIDGQFNYELNDDDRNITITPNGAPVSYKSSLYQADKEYFSVDAGFNVRVASSVLLQLGVQGARGRDDMESTTAYIGTAIEF